MENELLMYFWVMRDVSIDLVYFPCNRIFNRFSLHSQLR